MLIRRFMSLLLGAAWVLPGPAVAAVAAEDQTLYKAYYLERHEKNFAEAKRLYDNVLAGKPDDADRQSARSGSDRCRDRLFADNFAALMPAESVAYVEVSRPGALVEKLAGMFGLTGQDVQTLLAERPSKKAGASFHVPTRFFISPAIFRFLDSFGGVAVALTEIRPSGLPTGVAVMHHGDADLVKGVLETVFQFAPTGEKAGGMATAANLDGGPLTAVLTESLLIVGTSRELVEGVTARLQGDGGASLATRTDLADVMARRTGATLFAFADLQALLKVAKDEIGRNPRDREEFEQINSFLDLGSLRWAAFAFGVRDGVLSADLTVNLADGHHCLAYDFLRLTPMDRSSLACVPGNAAAVVALGLNPPMALAGDAEGKSRNAVSVMDIGRELFWNMREMSAFVIPGKPVLIGGGMSAIRLPNAGLVLSVNDAQKSMALWSRLLSLPGMFAEGKAKPPKSITLGDLSATSFALPGGGEVLLARMNDAILLGTTRDVLKAAARARSKKSSVLDDAVMKATFDRMPSDACVMGVLHVGRMTEVGVSMTNEFAGGGMAFGPGPALAAHVKDLCKKTVVWAGMAQSANQLSVTFAASGMPDVNEALKRFGPVINTFAGMIDDSAGRRKATAQEARTRASRADTGARERKRSQPPSEPVEAD